MEDLSITYKASYLASWPPLVWGVVCGAAASGTLISNKIC